MARPVIIGQVVRRIEMYCGSGNSNKDYVVLIATQDNLFYRVYFEHGPSGRINQGGEKTTSPVSWFQASSIANDLRDSKLHGRSTYDLVSDQSYAFHPKENAAPLPKKTAPARPKAPKAVKPRIESLSPSSRAVLARLI